MKPYLATVSVDEPTEKVRSTPARRKHLRRMAERELEAADRAACIEARLAHLGMAKLSLAKCRERASARTIECANCSLALLCGVGRTQTSMFGGSRRSDRRSMAAL